MKAAIVVLLIVCVGMGVALLIRHNKAVDQQKEDEVVKVELTNRLEQAQAKFEEQERMNMFLQTNLTVTADEMAAFSNKFVTVSRNLSKTQADAKAAAEAAQAEISKREARINELSAQGEDLTKKISGLNASIGNLNQLIAETERKLEASEGDREFLLKELKRLQVEKAELERQFNDLDLLRTQVVRLKDELSVARRLDWIRRGIYGGEIKRGSEILLQGITAAVPRTNYNLNVELKQDGTTTVLPPTNAPAVQP
jgi:chromosome segregation ATPase